MMLENRKAKGQTKKDDISEGNSVPNPIGRPKKVHIVKPLALQGKDSLKEERAKIIEEKPNPRIVFEYFKKLVKKLEYDEESDFD